ncbi:GGDEF domain-containing protein [Methylogaea oryzae]|uniref:GGDEF domain-containing protein n=1 Tax=Methylogaea oryzae TaxID=1295382 RepID=UPI001C7FB43F|nr:diguanylate cyclase [Methylogaea oryzae]
MRDKEFALLCATLALALAGVIDDAGGGQLHVAYVYAAAVVLAAWHAGSVWGIVLSLASAISGTLAGLTAAQASGQLPLLAANQALALGFFLGVVFLTAKWKTASLRRALLQRTDRLTGLMSEYAFKEYFADEIGKLGRTNGSLVVLCIEWEPEDNAAVGRRVADDLDYGVARAVRMAVRKTDRTARLGRARFAVLLWDVAAEYVVPTTEKIYKQIALGACGLSKPLKFAIGAVPYAQPVETHLAALTAATQALENAQDLALAARQSGGQVQLACAPVAAPPADRKAA